MRQGREAGPRVLNQVHDLEQHVFPHGCEFVEILGQYVTNQFHIKSAGSKFDKADTDRIALDLGVAVQHAAHFGKHGADMLLRRVGVQTQNGFEKHLVAPAQILHIDGCHRAIGDGEQGPLFRAHAGGAKANILDRACAIAELADVPDADHFIT